MAISPLALKAYSAAAELQNGTKGQNAKSTAKETSQSFAKTIEDSLAQVNDLQLQKGKMVEDFASGKEQNVHELMISIQKAGIAMDMTSAVRNKVMQAYQELMRMQF